MFFRSFAVVLALLLAGILVWVIAASSEDSSSTQRRTSPSERQAVRIEQRLARDPTDEKLLLASMNAWTGAGSDRFESLDFSSKPIAVPDAVEEDYEAGVQAWNAYLRQSGGEAGKDQAQTAGTIYFQLVEIGSTDPAEVTANAAEAVRAQRIVCKHESTLFTLSDLAVYHYFNGEYAAGDKAATKAGASAVKEKAATTPRGVIDQLNEYKERGERFVARVKRGFKTLEETGEEELETPIKGYGAPAGINGYEPR